MKRVIRKEREHVQCAIQKTFQIVQLINKIMKTLTIILSMLSLLTYNSFSQNADVKGLLDKPETRTEIFKTIMNDHELMMDFIKAMKGNDHAMMMMQNEKTMGWER